MLAIFQELEAIRDSQDYKNLKAETKEVIDYLLDELDDIIMTRKIDYYASSRYQRIVRIFELKFQRSNLIVYTIHRHGARRINYFERLSNANEVKETIYRIFEKIGCEVTFDDNGFHRGCDGMKVIYHIPEEAAPWGAAFSYYIWKTRFPYIFSAIFNSEVQCGQRVALAGISDKQ